MAERRTTKRARRDAREGKAPSTQAGEFVREEMEHVREGKHGARSAKQAIAIGLSKARRAGVRLPAKKGTSARTKAQAKRDLAKGRTPRRKVSATRSRAVRGELTREGRRAASSVALAKQARSSARRRSAAQRSPRLGRPLGRKLGWSFYGGSQGSADARRSSRLVARGERSRAARLRHQSDRSSHRSIRRSPGSRPPGYPLRHTALLRASAR